MSRKTISAAQLHALLEREFRQARSMECVSRCRITAPLFRDGGGGVANWYIETPVTCPRHCHRVIAEVVAKLSALYDMQSPSGALA